MYSNLTLFKNYLGIDASDTTQDEILTFYLNSANCSINKYCGVQSFDKNQYEEIVFIKEGYSGTIEMYLNNKPVISLDSIGGTAYEGEKGKDYLVVNERKVILTATKNPQIVLGYLPIIYTAGYDRSNEGIDEIPADLQLVEMMLATGLKQSKESLGGIQSYKLGDETVTFGSWSGDNADMIYTRVKSILDHYKNFKLNY